jgi:uncharacterized protein (DUF1800 family)
MNNFVKRFFPNLVIITLLLLLSACGGGGGGGGSAVTNPPPAPPNDQPPTITLLGEPTVDIEQGSAYTDAGATAVDEEDGDITSSIVVDNPVDEDSVGTYAVTYNVTDSAGNAASEVSRTVNVTADATPPVISLLGASVITIAQGTSYTDQGATASDNIDGDISANIVTVNLVDPETAATYSVTYDVSDAAGNAAEQVVRTVIVEAPTIPEISFNTLQSWAYESTGSQAEIQVLRVGGSSAISVPFVRQGNDDPRFGSASEVDYQLFYADGSAVGSTIDFADGDASRTLYVKPLADTQREVPETLNLILQPDDSYQIVGDHTAEVIIAEATPTAANQQLFLGTFSAQDGATTDASGYLTFILDGHNDRGTLTYTYANLGSQRTDQHIHLWPSGTIIHDIKDEDLESSGSVSGYEWDLEPGGIFTTKQQMLDALFNGEFYINVHSASFPVGEIVAHMIFDATAEPPDDDELTPEQVDNDIARFLTQATFGATPQHYEELRSMIDTDGSNREQVYELWIDQQMSQPATSMLALDDHTYALFPTYNRRNVQHQSFWPIALFAKDQLRQRMAFALSQILVISRTDSNISRSPRGMGAYWDLLAANAFGSYRQLLEDVTYSPMMGLYLSHYRNAKADEQNETFPDENFAREIMQLFTFGLVHRRQDGSIILANNNLPISTYDNTVITAMARVFTGLGLSYTSDPDGSNVRENTNFNRGRCGPLESEQYCFTQPMKFFPDYHDFGEKQLFQDDGLTLVIPASSATNEEAAMAEIDTVLDGLVAHSTTAPFISRQLIQRFVTSNPSPGYIERVANAFGDTGDMTAVIKAILLDPEARSPSVAGSTTFGKLKEPLLQLTAVMRLFDAKSHIALGAGNEDQSIVGTDYQYADHFEDYASIVKIGPVGQIFGQQVLTAPSVFNFYPPDFSPTGALASQGLVAPELKLVNETQVYSVFNAYNALLGQGVYYQPLPFTPQQTLVFLSADPLEQIWETQPGTDLDKATAVVDFVDYYLNAGKLKQTDNQGTRQELISAVQLAPCQSDGICERYNLAIYGAAVAPEFQVQQ